MIGSWSRNFRRRPWLAAATAYLVALQLVLTGFAASHPGVAGDPLSDGSFVTCLGHSIGLNGDEGAPGQQPTDQAPCVVCTLLAGTCGILPVATAVSTLAGSPAVPIASPGDDQVVGRDIPIAPQQRGPPATRRIAV